MPPTADDRLSDVRQKIERAKKLREDMTENRRLRLV